MAVLLQLEINSFDNNFHTAGIYGRDDDPEDAFLSKMQNHLLAFNAGLADVPVREAPILYYVKFQENIPTVATNVEVFELLGNIFIGPCSLDTVKQCPMVL